MAVDGDLPAVPAAHRGGASPSCARVPSLRGSVRRRKQAAPVTACYSPSHFLLPCAGISMALRLGCCQQRHTEPLSSAAFVEACTHPGRCFIGSCVAAPRCQTQQMTRRATPAAAAAPLLSGITQACCHHGRCLASHQGQPACSPASSPAPAPVPLRDGTVMGGAHAAHNCAKVGYRLSCASSSL